MIHHLLLLGALLAQSPAFEVAAIKPSNPDESGRYITMQGAHRFVARNYTLKRMIGAAYNLNPASISGGPAWVDSDRYDILAATPGEKRPPLEEQMAMLRTLLAERFALTFHLEHKELSIYALTVSKGGSKLKESTLPPDDPAQLINTVFPDHVRLPARNATMAQFASMMQRAVLDRPLVHRTGLAGRYDFDLEWAPDETQFGGGGPPVSPEASAENLFAAIQHQLGLKLEPTKGSVEVLVVDRVTRPSAN